MRSARSLPAITASSLLLTLAMAVGASALVGCSSVPEDTTRDRREPRDDMAREDMRPSDGEPPDAGPDGDAAPDADAGKPSLFVRESVEQLHVTHAVPGATLTLLDADGNQVQVGMADQLGSYIFRRVPPGEGYVIQHSAGNPDEVRDLRVYSMENSLPEASFYRKQVLQPGFNYIRTRDGTTLSAYITLPGPIEEGPYPTVVNYSGYAPSKPGEPLGDFGALCNQFPALCDAPNDGASLIAALLGYATVSVNMRGTGCSGGAYDFFETLQLLDGYDVIETVAAQPWVLHNHVGMVGLSYPGISQLFVASVRPPSLAAITPLSVIGNTATTLLPGGILNNGFALNWVENVLEGTAPYGQGWEQAQVDAGDTECAENQLLHGQRVDNVEMARTTPYYVPELVDPLNPTLFVDEIQVPVFFASAFQDEQTGPFFTTLLDRFTGSPLVRINVYNGVHIDGFAPQILAEWKFFLDFYVARQLPSIDPGVRGLAPVLFNEIFGAQLTIPPDRFSEASSFEEALAAYEKEPSVRAIFENGAAEGKEPGVPTGAFSLTFPSWPPPETTVHRLYLRGDGSLQTDAPTTDEGASQFQLDPEAGARGILAPGGNVWDPLPAYDWRQPTATDAVSFITPELTEELVMLGTGSADLWIRSTVDDADLEVTITEVRPDGQEMYVQSGWLRASQRQVSDSATELWPDLTQREKDVQPLVPGEWTMVRVPIAGFGHVFRPGSRIRIIIDTPGDSRAEWRFALKEFPGSATHAVGHSVAQPSSVALPLLQGVTAPSPLPPCPSLRGQPCRTYQPFTNTPAP